MKAALISATSLLALLVFDTDVARAVIITPPVAADIPDVVVEDDNAAATAPDVTPKLDSAGDDTAGSLFFSYATTAQIKPTDAIGPFAAPESYSLGNLAPWARVAANENPTGGASDSVFVASWDQPNARNRRTAGQSGATESYTYNLSTTRNGPMRMGALGGASAGSTTVTLPGIEREALAGPETDDAADGMAPANGTGQDDDAPAEANASLDVYVYTPVRRSVDSITAGLAFTPRFNPDAATLADMPVEVFPFAAAAGAVVPADHGDHGDAPDPVIAAGGLLAIPLDIVNTESDDIMDEPLPIFYDIRSLLAGHRPTLVERFTDLVDEPLGIAVLGGGLAALAGLAGLGSLAFFDRRKKT